MLSIPCALQNFLHLKVELCHKATVPGPGSEGVEKSSVEVEKISEY